MSRSGYRTSFVGLVCAAALVVAACGGDDETAVSIPDAADPVTTSAEGGSPDAVAATSTVFVPVGAELFDSNFAQVCRGTGLPQASSYEPVAGVHPLVSLSSDDGVEFTGSFTTTLPDGWSVLYPDLASAELVLCQTVVSTTPTELCTGYTDDDNPDAGESSVQMFNVTYEVSARVATSAEVLHTETVEATDEACPMLVFFSEDDPDPKPWNASIDDSVIELIVRPFVDPS